MVVAVASVVYNMAGDLHDRPNFLKSIVARHMLSDTKDSLGETLVKSYSSGPYTRLRSFYTWAKKPGNYDQVGFPTGRIQVTDKIPVNKLASHIPAKGKNWKVRVLSASIGYGELDYWADQYMLANHPNRFNKSWDWDYFPAQNQIEITMPNGTTKRFTPKDFSYLNYYIYAYYEQVHKKKGEVTDTQVFIYRVGSGDSDLDKLARSKANYGEFLPFIPVRLDNKFLSNSYKKAAYQQCKDAYKKATHEDYDDLIEGLKDNEDLKDIDHAYIVFGVALNTKETAGKKYVYEFFKNLIPVQEGGANAYAQYRRDMREFKKKTREWEIWNSYRYKNAKDEPEVPTEPDLPKNTIRVSGTGSINSYYDIRIKWDFIRELNKKGRGRPKAKPGEIWTKVDTVVIGKRKVKLQVGSREYIEVDKPIEEQRLRIYWQRTKTTYTILEIYGAEHRNLVYKAKSVFTDVKEAMNDADESGFIVPLHYDTWKNLSIVNRTQLSLSCCYIVFNCYKIRKRKWYERGIFRIFLAIVIAIASVVFTGGAGIGLLGAHMTVGAAFGFSGMTAAIVGSVVNAMAAMLLSTMLEKFTQNLGILGPLVGFLLGSFLGSAFSSLGTGTFSFDWSSLLRVDNLLKLTSAVGDTLVKAIQEDTLGIIEKWKDFQENAEEAAKKIQQAFFEQFGYGAISIDPMMFTEHRQDINLETPTTFLTRTLLTGSEIAEMSRELLYDFPKYSLELPNAFSDNG